MESCERCGAQPAPYVLTDEVEGTAYIEARLCKDCLKRIVLGPNPNHLTEEIIDEILSRYAA